MSTPRKWTLDKLVEEASKYGTLKDFRLGSEGAYKAYLTQGKPKEVSDHLDCGRTIWTEYTARLEAKKYSRRWDFQRGSGGAYRFLWKSGALDEIFDPITNYVWDEESVRLAALGLLDRRSFKAKFPGAYKFAYNNSLLESLFGVTLNTPKCDNDLVYLWRPFGYKNVYKVGITSKRLGSERVNYVSNKSGLGVAEVFFIEAKDAKALESKILGDNQPYGFFPKFSGSTEFRVIPKLEDYLEGVVE